MTTNPKTNARYGTRRPPHPELGRVPYFVTTRTHQSRRIFSGEIARQAVDILEHDRDRYGFLLLAYAFMPDHAHFVVVPAPARSISETMRIIKGRLARCANRALGQKGRVWQEGFYERVPRTQAELNGYIEYIHRNPVNAGIVKRDADYEYSSAREASLADYHRWFEEERRD